MECDNVFCIYQKNGNCKLENISIDNSGMCTQCIYVEIDDKDLLKTKTTMIKRF